MRRFQKNQVEDFAKLLDQAHAEIMTYIEKNAAGEALSLLEQCQQGAIQIGNLIEKTESEGCAAIPLLEQYCELLYQLHEEIGQNQKEIKKAARAMKHLRQILIRIESSIKHDIKVRTEAVFLPYKACMWDSLESIWRAAEEDEDCDAYVIPIPYYDKNPDGSFKEMHYEAEMYPDYVPVIDYRSYDFEKRRPDMIFIHNPYDECNYVTSVPSSYYSKNLKKYTDQLVYIPYFILNEIQIENKKAIEAMKHFCTVPGVIHADRVVVQSESMRQIYINVLTEETGKDTREYWENKILGMGSPKIDKLLRTKKENLEIPESWLKIILKPDGTWKKIVLYNTGVSSLLNYNEKMVEKMKEVFTIFKENQNDIALLWRPHPLIKATIESMRPNLWTEYEKLVREFKEERWGIYDDSADMDRALIISDAYYGNGSSLVQLFEKTGKPIMIQNTEMSDKESDRRLTGKEKIQLFFNAVAMVDDKIGYASAYNLNGLFKINTESGKCEYLTRFPDEALKTKNLHFCAEYSCGKVFFFPQIGKYISVYHILSGEIQTIELPQTEYAYYSQRMKFAQSFLFQDKIYAVGASYPAIIEIAPWNLELKIYPLDFGERKILFRAGGTLYDRSFYIPSVTSNILLQFCMEDKKSFLIEMPEGYQGAWSAACDGKRVWLAPRYHDDPIVYYDILRRETGTIDRFPEGFTGGDDLFLRCIYRNGFIWMYPEKANMGFKINPDSFDLEEIKEINRLEEDETYGCWFIEGRYLYGIKKKKDADWIDENDNENFIVNLDTWETKPFSFCFCGGVDKRRKDMADEYKAQMQINRFEGKILTLEELLFLIPYMHTHECNKNSQTTVGKQIYSVLRKAD